MGLTDGTLKLLVIRELEENDRRGYENLPVEDEEALRWELEAHWPEA